MAENFFEKAEAFAGDAAIDTAADTEINRVIDGVAGHVPGGGMIDGMAKTGIDLAVNNEINSKLGGIFGHHDAAPVAEAAAPDESQASDAPDDGRTDDQN